jgi:LysM repeat protein
MKETVGRLSLALLLLIGVWVTVYTLWQPGEPPITFGANPQRDPVVPPPPQEPEEAPEPQIPQPQDPVQPAPTIVTPAVTPPQFVQYTIQSGDTLQSISKRFFGTSAHATAIGRANPFMDPSKLRPGRVIRVPRDPENIQGKPRPGQSCAEPGGDNSAGFATLCGQERGHALGHFAAHLWLDVPCRQDLRG